MAQLQGRDQVPALHPRPDARAPAPVGWNRSRPCGAPWSSSSPPNSGGDLSPAGRQTRARRRAAGPLDRHGLTGPRLEASADPPMTPNLTNTTDIPGAAPGKLMTDAAEGRAPWRKPPNAAPKPPSPNFPRRKAAPRVPEPTRFGDWEAQRPRRRFLERVPDFSRAGRTPLQGRRGLAPLDDGRSGRIQEQGRFMARGASRSHVRRPPLHGEHVVVSGVSATAAPAAYSSGRPKSQERRDRRGQRGAH